MISLSQFLSAPFWSSLSLTKSQKTQAQMNIGLNRNLASFGAVGDYNITTETGTDDSNAIESALNWWIAQAGATLEIEPGFFQITRPLRINAAGNNLYMGKILGNGGWLQSRITSTPGTGTVAIAGTTLTGTGTAFLTQLNVADHIVVNGTAYSIRTVTSNTSASILAMNTALSHTEAAGSAFTIWPPMILLYSQGSNRRPQFDNIRVRGHASIAAGSLIAVYAQNGAGETWDGMVWNSLHCQGFLNTALELGPGVFESNFNDLEIGGSSTATIAAVRVLHGTQIGDISSIHFYAPNLRGGLNGLLSTCSDLHIHGGTAINSKQYGVYLVNWAGTVSGFHVENNWFGVAGADTQAGMKIIAAGPCKVANIYGTGTDFATGGQSGQRHALNIVASAPISVLGGYETSGVGGATYAYVLTSGGGAIKFHDVAPANVSNLTGNVVSFFNTGKISPAGFNFKTVGQPFGAGTVTPNLTYGPRCYITGITGNLTINAPAVAPTALTPASGDVFQVELQAEATGGRTVTFNAIFVTLSAVATVANKTTIIHFQYSSASKWQELYRSVA